MNNNGSNDHCVHAFVEKVEGDLVKVTCHLCPFERVWPLQVRYHPEPVVIGSRLYPVTVRSIGVNICAGCQSPICTGSAVGIPAGDGEQAVGIIWFHSWCAPMPVLCDPAKIELQLSVDKPAFAI